jgi:ABC-type uncharacterized transport system
MIERLRRLSVQGLSLVTLIAASAILVLSNFIASRNVWRLDVTENQRYSLSPATLETLSSLKEPVQVWLLQSTRDPARLSLRQALVAYEAASRKIEVHSVDPDQNPLAFAEAKQRFKMNPGRTEGASIVADSWIVVASGDRHWFVSQADLMDVEKSNDPRARPREERALTGAIRNVSRGTKPRLCFVQGHGERELTDASPDGLAFLQTLLEKDNYETLSIDSAASHAPEPFKACSVVLVPGLRAPLSKEEEARLRSYLLAGGNALLAVGPLSGDTGTGLLRPNLAEVTRPFGIDFEEDLAIELDEKLAFPDSRGVRFLATAKDHAISQALIPAPNRIQLQTLVQFSRSLRSVPSEGSAIPSVLLTSSELSYGITSIAGASSWKSVPDKKSGDVSGPLPLAFASERPALTSTQKGPRLVVLGSSDAFQSSHWRAEGNARGMAMLVENAIAWLASTPQVLDVPERQDLAAGIRITAEAKSEIERFVLAYVPLACALLGLMIFLFRKSGERAPYVPLVKPASEKKV